MPRIAAFCSSLVVPNSFTPRSFSVRSARSFIASAMPLPRSISRADLRGARKPKGKLLTIAKEHERDLLAAEAHERRSGRRDLARTARLGQPLGVGQARCCGAGLPKLRPVIRKPVRDPWSGGGGVRLLKCIGRCRYYPQRNNC